MGTIDKKVYAIWSPKGGVGKTFITSHLAKYASTKGLLTGVIDFNRQAPSTAAALNIRLPREKSLKEALYTERESDVITNFHNNEKDKDLFCTGLNVNNDVDDLFEVTDHQIIKLLEIAKSKFNILLLDLPTSYLELTSYESWKHADKIVVVIDNDYNTIVALKSYIKFLKEVNIPLNNLIVVINKDMGLLSGQEVEEMCGLPVSVTIPFYKQIVKDMNEGKTVFETGGSFKDRKIIQGIQKLYSLLTNNGDKVRSESKSLFKIGKLIGNKKVVKEVKANE